MWLLSESGRDDRAVFKGGGYGFNPQVLRKKIFGSVKKHAQRNVSADALYTVSQKTRHQTVGHNFTNYYPIFKIFSLADLVVNLQQTYV